MDESYIICNNNSLKPYPKEAKIGERYASLKSGLATPLCCRRTGDFDYLVFTLVPQGQWQSNENTLGCRSATGAQQCNSRERDALRLRHSART